MKKVLLIAAFAIAAVSAMAQVQYVVSGTLTENGKKVYLIDELTERAIDSTVVADGKFAFSGTADKDALMAVRAKKSHWTTQFFNDGTPVNINLNDSTLKGSQQNERLAQINYEMEQPRKRFAAKTANLTEADIDRKSTRLNSSHLSTSRMPSSA